MNHVEALEMGREIMDRLRAAMRTMRLLPSRGCRPDGCQSHWPTVVQRLMDWVELGSPTFHEDYKHLRERIADERNHVRFVPTAQAIEEMDEALRWLGLVSDPRHRRALLLRTNGVRSARIAREEGVSRATIPLWLDKAIKEIIAGLAQRKAA